MKKSIPSYIKVALLFLLMATLIENVKCQSPMPDILTNGKLDDQMNYIEERTRIYENYRAIREDMFQMIKDNAIDSLSAAKMEINGLQDIISVLNNKIDSLATTLTTTDNKLDEITATKNSIGIFGMKVNKITYNAITWTLLAGLLFLLAVGFLAFKRNLFVVYHTKKELEELKNEFEAYRQTTREAREKMSMDHFNELRKLKGQ